MEFEIKYSVPDEAHLEAILSDPQVCAAQRGNIRVIEMETTYLDTPDQLLSNHKWMLRRRMENGCSVITCKTPAVGYARHEWDCCSADPIAALPMLIAQGAPSQLAEIRSLLPVCGARFTRRALLLECADFTAELALDSGILFRFEKTCPLRELELELKSGSGNKLISFAAQLSAAHALREEPRSKFVRARSL